MTMTREKVRLDTVGDAIRADLSAGDAGYRAAGEKFIAQKKTFKGKKGAWSAWLKAEKFEERQVRRYMAYAKTDSGVRFDEVTRPAPKTPKAKLPLRWDLMLQMVDAGFKIVSKANHPDTGGNAATQAELSAARTALRQVVRMMREKDK